MCMERSLGGGGTNAKMDGKLELCRGTTLVTPRESCALEKSALHVKPPLSSCETQLKCKLLKSVHARLASVPVSG